jgi:hypothetical protein
MESLGSSYIGEIVYNGGNALSTRALFREFFFLTIDRILSGIVLF